MRSWAAASLVVIGVVVAQAQCTRAVSIHNEDFVYFPIGANAGVVVRGDAGYSFSKLATNAASMALKGRAFVIDRVEIEGDQPPGGLMWVVYKRIAVHNPCAVPDTFPDTGAGGFAIPISTNATNANGQVIPGQFVWLAASGLRSSVRSYLDSFPGSYVVQIRQGQNISNAQVTQVKGPFFWVHTTGTDGSYNEAGQPPGNGDTWGSGGGFDDAGPGGQGLTRDDLDAQNVNNDSWWQALLRSLFEPSVETMDNFKASIDDLGSWGPLGFWDAVNQITQEYVIAEKAYVVNLPTPFGTQPMDMNFAAPVIKFFRFMLAGLLWWVFVMKVMRRIFEKF